LTDAKAGSDAQSFARKIYDEARTSSVLRRTKLEIERFCREKTSGEIHEFVSGFEILMGPPYENAPVLFIGFQPGRGAEDQHTAARYEVDWVSTCCQYATEKWRLAKRVREIFEPFDPAWKMLGNCIGLNVIFSRSPNEEVYNRSLPDELRQDVLDFCLPRVRRLIERLNPKKIIVIGFKTLELIKDGVETPLACSADLGKNGKHRVLVKSARAFERDVIATLHLTGSRISKNDREKINGELQRFILSDASTQDLS
jgi:hypothetical protein